MAEPDIAPKPVHAAQPAGQRTLPFTMTAQATPVSEVQE